MKNSIIKFSFLLVVVALSFQACNKDQDGKDKGKKSDDSTSSKTEMKNDAPKTGGKEVTIDGFTFDVTKHIPDTNPGPKEHKAPEGLDLASGDAKVGEKIYLQVKIKKGKPAAGNCAACHCVTGMTGCGNIGPVFDKTFADKWKEQGDAWLYAQIADARINNAESVMPPTIITNILKPEDIVHLIAYLKTIN